MRGRSNSPSCITYSSLHSTEPHAKTRAAETYTSKGPSLGTENSVLDLDDSPLTDLPDRKELSKHKRSVQDHHHSDHLFPGFYKNNFNFCLETPRNKTYDEYLAESQIVPECKDESLKLENNASPVEIPQLTTAKNGQLHESSLQQCHASVSISRSIAIGSLNMSSMGRLPNSNLQQLNSRPDKDFGLRNFSLFLRPGVLSKADDQHQGATESAVGPSSLRVQDLKSNKDKTPAGDKALALEPGIGSTSAKDIHKHQDLVTIKTDQTQQIGNPSDESPPDELSEAPVQKNAIKSKRFEDQLFPSSTSSLPANTVKGNPDREKSKDQLAAATSICSRGASNDISYSSLRRKNKDEEMMASPSEIAEGDQQVPKPAAARAGMAMRMPMGVGCSPAIFSNSAMLGFPARQVLPMPLSLVPFIPFAGWPSTYAVPVSATSGAATPVELMRSGSAPSLSSKDAVIQNINSETSNTR
ncbi:hypothetical protein P3X46_003366 [Hevea brasiliensis]|uniref:Uncharacterized protein n=1 Tax=Hevea brasiliensis TaxID=3981 RepID=A0ABQ9NAV4_HEVBR|nr:hypothetical protein P3X46_003366 [Hevea brasiliensis]